MKTRFSINWITVVLTLLATNSFKAISQPTAVIHVGTNQQVGNTICFDGSQSFAYNSSLGQDDIFQIKSYYWSFGDGTATSGSDKVTTTHTYTYAGTFTVTLTVTGYDLQVNTTTTSVIVGTLPSVTVYSSDGPALIQTKISSMAGGGIVNIQAGTYNITSTLYVPAGVQLKGAGIGQTIFQYALSSNKKILETDGDNISISGIEFLSTTQGERDGIMCYAEKNLYVSNCKFKGFRYANSISKHGSATFEDNDIIENIYHPGYGIQVGYDSYAMIRDNLFKNNRHSIAGGGYQNTTKNTGYDVYDNTFYKDNLLPDKQPVIDMHPSGHGRIRIINNTIRDVKYGIGLKDGWGEIKNNTFENIYGYYAIKFGYPVFNGDVIDNAGVYDMDVSGNTFTGGNSSRINYLVKHGKNITINQVPVDISYVDEWWEETDNDYDDLKKRVVSGDFDNDGYHDDIAAMQDFGNSQPRLYVWKAQPSSSIMTFSSPAIFRTESSFNAWKVSGRFVSGDFDNDGHIDDLAAMYDYGTAQPKIFVWKSSGYGFSYPSTWRTESSFHAWKVTGRFVSGDFDNDGYEDDIAAMYDYGTTQPKIFVWKSNGSSFSSPQTWRTETSFYASKATDRFVSGDFDGDGYKDDIAAIYDYGGSYAKVWVWESDGSKFSSLKWRGTVSPYSVSSISGRVVAGDFNSNNPSDDIAAIYYTSTTPLFHEWLSHEYPFEHRTYYPGWKPNESYNASKAQYMVVSGDFDCDDKNDNIAFIYYAGSNVTRLYSCKSMVQSEPGGLKSTDGESDIFQPEDILNGIESDFHLYPNPLVTTTTLSYSLKEAARVNLSIYNLSGQIVNTLINQVLDAGTNSITWDGTDNSGNPLTNGIYIYRLMVGDQVFTGKFAIQK